MKNYIAILFAALVIVSCGSSKHLEGAQTAGIANEKTNTIDKKEYIEKVVANAVDEKNIVAKIDFSISVKDKDISVDGKLQMRRDQMIRITLSPFGLMEVGRLEFAPDYVLLVDRMNKEYVRATYNDLEFLRSNGLDFYSLQSLFWNELFAPGQTKIPTGAFDVDLSNASTHDVTLKSGDLGFTWATTANDHLITSAKIEYGKSTSKASTATWTYSDFKAVGAKKYPATHKLSFRSSALDTQANVVISLGKVTTKDDWDIKTTLSDKYKKVSAEDVFRKLISM